MKKKLKAEESQVEVMVSFRVTKKQKKKLEIYCVNNNIKMTHWLRKKIDEI